MPRLILTDPEFLGQSCDLTDGTFTVGRSRSNRIILPHDSVSAEHCELLVHGQEVIVRDRCSRNGTFVNEVRVQAQSGVSHGQRLRFGKMAAVVQMDDVGVEDPSEITAFNDFKRWPLSAPNPPSEPPHFHVSTALGGAGSEVDATMSVPRALSIAIQTTPGNVTAQQVHSSRGRARRLFLFSVGAALVLLWLGRRLLFL